MDTLAPLRSELWAALPRVQIVITKILEPHTKKKAELGTGRDFAAEQLPARVKVESLVHGA